MGCLRRHELTGYIKDYGLEYYFETGTGQAEALQHAVNYPFKKCYTCLLYTSPSPRDGLLSRMPSSA